MYLRLQERKADLFRIVFGPQPAFHSRDVAFPGSFQCRVELGPIVGVNTTEPDTGAAKLGGSETKNMERRRVHERNLPIRIELQDHERQALDQVAVSGLVGSAKMHF